MKSINHGVAQVCKIDPLFFLFYINHLPNSASCVPRLSADDTYLLISDSTFSNLIDNMNKELDKVSDWSKANKLSVNPAKSNAMLISPKHSVSYNDIALKYNNKPISLTNKVKYLGVILESKLDYHAHITLIENKTSRSMGMICKLRNFFPRSIY